MYLKSVQIKNVRGFESLDFDFERGKGTNSFAGWTVITGDNGSGKSAFLKAIAVALVGADAGRSLQPSFRGWRHTKTDESEVSEIRIEVFRTQEEDRIKSGGAPPQNPFPATIHFRATENARDVQPHAYDYRGKVKHYTPHRTIWAVDAGGWFSCGYGPFRRIFGASPEATRQMVAPATERFVTMFQEAASLAEVDQWMRNLHHKQLENKAAEKATLDQLLRFLRDDLLPEGMHIDRIDSDGLWLRDRTGSLLSWPDMSDGYRSALALMADIVRHLVNNYGHNDIFSENDEGKSIVNKSGVILIDEIDAHLHPSWQRKIGFWLKTRFPRMQFIVTSHSPLICQAADPFGLFVLPVGEDRGTPRQLSSKEYNEIISSRSDTILLSNAFGLENTRSQKIVAMRSQYSKLRSKKRAGSMLNDQERAELEQLEMFIVDEEM